MNRKGTLLGIAALAIACSGAPAMAELLPVTGVYVGILGGRSNYGQHQQDFDRAVIAGIEDGGFALVNGTSDLDNTDLTFGLLVGYRMFDYLAIEGGYVDMGKMKYSAEFVFTDGVDNFDGTTTFSAEAKGPLLTVVGILPFDGPWEVFVRGGLFFSDVKFNADAVLGGVPGSSSASSSEQETLYGGGATFHLGDHISMRGEYTKILDLGDDETGEEDISMLSLHFLWRF